MPPAAPAAPPASLRAAIFDVDGVLTDGGLVYGADGEVLKRFSVLDGHGLKLLRSAGLRVLVVSGRDSPPLRRRLADLGLGDADVRLGQADKLPAAQALLEVAGLSWSQVAAIGDDWPDLPLLARAAFSAAPPHAHAEVLARVHHVTRAPGGAGAAREFCDLLLKAVGRYDDLLAEAGA
jgi:3-deoxy-D-manno-octulosonate 8-phosphate phosphatase (KDO 8-P phosphatase)